MTKDELKAEAKKLGVKIKENFMDDPVENMLFFALGFVLGYLLFGLLL